MLTQYIVIGICALLIAAALLLFIRSIRQMVKGRCCEGCAGCPQVHNCSTRQQNYKGEPKEPPAGPRSQAE